MNMLAIINPSSGGGKTNSEIFTLEQSLGEIADQVLLTKYPGHATEIVKGNNSVETIAVVGGDGTLFECLNGMNGFGQNIAPVPTGTGNSLAQDLGIHNWKTGVANCTFGVRQKIDAISIGSCKGRCRLFHVAIASVTFVQGFDCRSRQSPRIPYQKEDNPHIRGAAFQKYGTFVQKESSKSILPGCRYSTFPRKNHRSVPKQLTKKSDASNLALVV